MPKQNNAKTSGKRNKSVIMGNWKVYQNRKTHGNKPFISRLLDEDVKKTAYKRNILRGLYQNEANYQNGTLIIDSNKILISRETLIYLAFLRRIDDIRM